MDWSIFSCSIFSIYVFIVLVDGSLRLTAGGSSPYIYGGRLELYEAGGWGTICNDVWDRQDASVACTQMGFSGFTNFNASFAIGDPSQRILLDNVECFGTEATLTTCSHKGIGEHNCAHIQDVGVACSRGTCAAVYMDASLNWTDHAHCSMQLCEMCSK